MLVDKVYCMSSFLTFRYVVDEDRVFDERYPHKNLNLIPDQHKMICDTPKEIDKAIRKQLEAVDLSNAGILLSGGMDSAILASYMPEGTKAYTARCDGPNAVDETRRAKKYCEINGLEHVIVDVCWDDYRKSMDGLMLADGCPVFANEPQVNRVVEKMKRDGIEIIIYGDMADVAFGGMDQLLSKDWKYEEWKKRYTFVEPKDVLVNFTSMDPVYSEYRMANDKIDFIRFMNVVFARSSSAAYVNSFRYNKMKYLDPYAVMRMSKPYDLARIRSGESKYLIRELFRMKYPKLEIPEKIAMARAADYWLKDWKGPVRAEFKEMCIEGLNGEQKFLIYSLERFLNLLET